MRVAYLSEPSFAFILLGRFLLIAISRAGCISQLAGGCPRSHTYSPSTCIQSPVVGHSQMMSFNSWPSLQPPPLLPALLSVKSGLCLLPAPIPHSHSMPREDCLILSRVPSER